MSTTSRIGAGLVLLLGTASCDSVTNPLDEETTGELAAAFANFNSTNVKVVLSGNNVIIESNGYPDHASPYWSPTSPLYVAPTAGQNLAPGYINNFTGS